MSETLKVNDDFAIKNSLETPLGIVNFSDLKQLIFKCFIQLKSEYKKAFPIVFKSLNDNEIYRIKTLAGSPENPTYHEKINLYYFLYSIYSINNVNILGQREAFLNEMVPFIKSMHPKLFNFIMNELFQLGQRVNEAIKLVERYSLEPDSRWLWVSLRDKSLNSADITGITGTEKLGYNICQLLWTYFNRKEDEKLEFERMWSCAKLVASVINPKAIQKLNSHEENRKIEEKNRKEAIIYGKDYTPRFKIETREELVDELEKQMLGEKDEHDLIIERHLKKVKYNEMQQHRQANQSQKEMKNDGKNPLVDYDEEAIAQKLEQNRLGKKVAEQALKGQREKLVDEMDDLRPKLNPHYATQQLTEEDIKILEKEAGVENLLKKSGMLDKFVPDQVQKKPIDPEIYLRKYRKK